MTNRTLQQIFPKCIRVDRIMQIRDAINDSVVQEYAEAMEYGAAFPPIVVFYIEDQGEYVLADGCHRLLAHRRARGDQPIESEVISGTLSDAQWFSYSANKHHGLRRSNAEKARAVRAALLHEAGAKLSDRQIAEHVGVSSNTVAKYRREFESTSKLLPSNTRTGRDGRTINTTNIGKQSATNKPDGLERVCNECKHYDDVVNYCTLKKQLQQSSDEVCDNHQPKRLSSIKSNRRPISPNRRPKGTIEVYLPLDNPQLAAEELRERFPLDYLLSVFRALEGSQTAQQRRCRDFPSSGRNRRLIDARYFN